MKIAHLADSHFDSSPGGRFDECIRVHDWIAEDIARRQVDLALHAGDINERKSNIEERNAVRAWAQKMTETCPMILLGGNHDARHDLDIFGHLRTRHALTVEEAAAVHVQPGCVVGCLAWPTKASVLAAGDVSHLESEQVAAGALRTVLRGLGDQMAAQAIRHSNDLGDPPTKIMLAHAMARGSRVSTGQPLIGASFEIGLEDLRLAYADYYALGHVHCHQSWSEPGAGDIVYPGSPRRTAYGETEDKGYVIIECDGTKVTWEFVTIPCTRMLLIGAEWSDGGLHFTRELDPDEYRGADCRLRYSYPAENREAAKAGAENLRKLLMDAGAEVVKLDPQPITTSEARAPEVAKARTLEDKLKALWAAKGTTPEPERAERLIGYAHELERDVS